ncbi:MAG: protein phosphatase 2C domain-containing protein [Pirellulaceae bacterium]|nr:protein phosphatase 2C domain-containing protein [Pirellulaceae bacterium]
MSHEEQETAERVTRSEFADRFFAPHPTRWSVHIGAGSDVGRVRKQNEDHFVVVRRSRGRCILSTNLPGPCPVFPEEYAHVLAVADGVGGHSHGEFASQLALETALELAGNATSWVMRVTDLEAVQMRARIEAYAQHLQETLRSYIDAYPHLRGMATTWTCAYVVPPYAIVSHVGDSRAYLSRGRQLHQITRDDTVAQELSDAGVPREAIMRFRHVLTCSLGGDAGPVSVKIYPCSLQPGDRLLLCTDGLSDVVSEATIQETLDRERDPQSACDKLIQQTLDQGAPDNVTVIVCDVQDAPPSCPVA